MAYTKTYITDLSPEVRNLIGIDVYSSASFNTNNYTSVSSDTALQELAEDLQNLIRKFPKTQLDWLHLCELSTEALQKKPDSNPKIDEEMLAVARLRQRPPLLIADLGWTLQEALETRSRLASFEEDWNAAGMELYDEL